MALAPPERAWRHVFQPKLLALIFENPRTLAKTFGVLAEVLQVSELVTARENPSAHTPNASAPQNISCWWQLLQSVIKCGFIRAEFDRQASGTEPKVLRVQVIKQPLESVFAQGREVIGIGIQAFEAVLGGEIH